MNTADLGQQPSRLPAANLSGAFAPPDRSSALSGLLSPTPTTPQPRSAAPRQASSGTSVNPQLGPPRDALLGNATHALVVIVYLPATLRTQLREVTAKSGSTYTDLALDAIDATHSRLSDLLQAPGRPDRPSSLFAGARPRRRQRHIEPQVQVSLRLTTSQLKVIDDLVSDCAASSRSALVATALRAYLNDRVE